MNIVKSIVGFCKRNSNKILMGLGFSLLGTSCVSAGIGAVKAYKKYQYLSEYYEDGEVPATEAVKSTVLYFAPSVASFVAGTYCIATAVGHLSNTSKALATAAAFAESKYDHLKDELKGSVDKKTLADADKKAKSKAEKESYESKSDKKISVAEMESTKGKIKCYDPFSGRYFYATLASLKQVEIDYNKDFQFNDQLSMNNLYYFLDKEGCDAGENYGFNGSDGPLSLYPDTRLDEDGYPCYVFQFDRKPVLLE